MQLNHTIRICILSGLFFVVLVGVLGYGWQTITREGKALVDSMQIVADRERLDREREALEKTLEMTAEKRDQLNDFIIAGDAGVVSFLSMVDGLAAELGVELATQKLEVTEGEDAAFDTLVVAFRADGRARSVTRLLQLLETLPYHGEVVGLQSTRTEDPTTGIVMADDTITLNISIINE